MTSLPPLPLTIRENPRARRVIVKLVPGVGLEVVTPRGFRHEFISETLECKRQWIAETARSMERQGRSPWPSPIATPDVLTLPTIDQTYQVQRVVREVTPTLTVNASRIILSGPESSEMILQEKIREFVRITARDHLPPMLRTMSQQLALPFESVSIRNQRRRWGSCSAKGRISLNCKALFLPLELTEHLMVHELCHLKHPDHSERYWKLVASHQPDYRRLERELRDGMRLVPGWMDKAATAPDSQGTFAL